MLESSRKIGKGRGTRGTFSSAQNLAGSKKNIKNGGTGGKAARAIRL